MKISSISPIPRQILCLSLGLFLKIELRTSSQYFKCLLKIKIKIYRPYPCLSNYIYIYIIIFKLIFKNLWLGLDNYDSIEDRY